MEAEDDLGFRSGWDAEALGVDGNAAIVTDLDEGALAPDEGPPGTARDGPEDGAFIFLGGVPGLLRFHFEFAMEFVPVAMVAQVGEVGVGRCEVGDVFAGEVGGETVLPEVVFAFDFAFGLGGGGVAEGDAVEVEGRSELGEGVGGVGEEEGMEVHIEFEGQAVFEKGGGEEVVIGEEVFVLVELGAGEEAAAVIEHVDHGERTFAARKPAVRRGIELEEFADLGTLPATNGGGGLGGGRVRGEVVCDGPATDLGAVHFEVTEAEDFAGGEAVVGGWRGGEAFAQECGDVVGPVGGVIAAGGAGHPKALLVMGAGLEVAGVEFIEAAAGEAEPVGGLVGAELTCAEAGEDVTDQRGGETVGELGLFCIGRR